MTQEERIEAEGVIVTEVTAMPTYNEHFASPHFVICIHHQGTMTLDYDSEPRTSLPQEVSVIYPNHTLCARSTTPDYRATLIVVSNAMFDTLSNHITLSLRFSYEQQPDYKLTASQYHDYMAIVEALRVVCRTQTPSRMEMIRSLLYTLANILNLYRSNGASEPRRRRNNSLSRRFYDALSKHCPPHRDVGFYANLFCLSPEYFSKKIYDETGHVAKHWIHQYVISQAKMMLRNQADAPIQQISDQLHFSEQSSFSRYFKRETGLSPDEWRQQQNPL